MRRRPAGVLMLLVGVLLGGFLTACGHSANKGQPTSARTWVAQQNDPPPVVDPQIPGEQTPGQPDQPNQPDQGGSTGKPGTAEDPNVVAAHLSVPWGLALLPDGSALVGERPTGRVLQVQPTRSPVATVATIGGIDNSGSGGLLGLAVSPSYNEDGLIYAYVTTKTDSRILRFSLGTAPTPILTGLPRGAGSALGGALAFGPDDDLYVSVGDNGHPSLADRPDSMAGKILRINVFGKPASGNPGGSAIYASGFHNVTGMTWDKQGRMYATDSGPHNVDNLDLIARGGQYGWPAVKAGDRTPLLQWKPNRIGPGGVAVLGFGLFIGELTGQKLIGIPLDTHGKPHGAAEDLLKGTYGRLRTVVAAPDGALWITTSNKDGQGKPAPTDDRVLRIKPPSSATNSPA